MNKQKTRKKVVAFLLSMLMLISLFQNISYTPIAEGGETEATVTTETEEMTESLPDASETDAESAQPLTLQEDGIQVYAGETKDLLKDANAILDGLTLKGVYKDKDGVSHVIEFTQDSEITIPGDADINMDLNFLLKDGNSIDGSAKYVYKLPDTVRVDVEKTHELLDKHGKSIGNVQISRDGTLTFQFYEKVVQNNNDIPFYVKFDGKFSSELSEGDKKGDLVFPAGDTSYTYKVDVTKPNSNDPSKVYSDYGIQKSGTVTTTAEGKKVIRWTISVCPQGRKDFCGTVVDVLPEGLTYQGNVTYDGLLAGGTITPKLDGNILSFDMDKCNTYYDIKISFDTEITPDYGATITNETSITKENTSTFNPDDTEDKSVTSNKANVKVTPNVLSKSGVNEGGVITWTVKINADRFDLAGSTYTDTLGIGQKLRPDSFTFTSPAGTNPNIVTDKNDNSFKINFGTSENKNYYEFTYQTEQTDWAASSLTNKGTMNGGKFNNYTTGDVSVKGVSMITKESIGYDSILHTLTWKITVNPETYDAMGAVKITDSFPQLSKWTSSGETQYDTMELVSVTDDTGKKLTVTDNGNGFTYTFADGALNNKSITLTVVTKLKDECIEAFDGQWRSVENKVEMTSRKNPTTPATAKAERNIEIKKTSLIEKTGKIQTDGTIMWQIRVNASEMKKNKILITDTIDNKQKYIAGSSKIATDEWRLDQDNGIYAREPQVSADGKTLTYTFDASDALYDSGYFNSQFYIRYYTKADVTVDKSNIEDTYNNKAKAEIDFDGDVHLKDEKTASVTGKVGGVVDKTAKYSENQNYIDWAITINKPGYNLSAAVNPRIVDKLASYYDYSMGTLYEVVNGVETEVPGSEYIITVVNQELTVQLPTDENGNYKGTATYVFKFRTRFNCLDVELPSSLTNSVSFIGLADVYEQTSQEIKNIHFSSSSAGASTRQRIRIKKVDADNPSKVLKDAVFEMYAGTVKVGEAQTDASGYAVFDNLTISEDATVKIHETAAPDGYDLPSATERVTTIPMSDFKTVSVINGMQTMEVVIKNKKTTSQTVTGSIVLTKVDAADDTPLAGAQFTLYTELPTAASTGLTRTTDTDGKVEFASLEAGTASASKVYYVVETKSPDGYLYDATKQVVIKASIDENGATTYEQGTIVGSAFVADTSANPLNQIKNTKTTAELQITKVDAASATTLLQGAVFGLYKDAQCTDLVGTETTGTDGKAVFTGLEPGRTYYYREETAPTGYVLDSTVKSITIGTGTETAVVTKKVTVENNKQNGSLRVKKVDDGVPANPIAGIQFKLKDSSSAYVQENGTDYTVTTDENGEAIFKNLPYGSYTLEEVAGSVPAKYTPSSGISVKIDSNIAKDVTVVNAVKNFKLQVVKVDKDNTTKKLSGAIFTLYSSTGVKLAEKETGADGTIEFDNLAYNGYYITEMKAPDGYNSIGSIAFSADKFSVVQSGTDWSSAWDSSTNTFTITVKDTKQKGRIVLKKTETNGTTPLEGAEFTLYKDGLEVGKVDSKVDGSVEFTELAYGTYTVQETKAPTVAGKTYIMDPTVYTVEVVSDTQNKITAPDTLTNVGQLIDSTNSLVTVTNDKQVTTPPNISFKLLKHAKNGVTSTKTALSGASFGFYEQTISGTEKLLATATSDNYGMVYFRQISIESCASDSAFVVRELHAPTGYKKSDIDYVLGSTKRDLTDYADVPSSGGSGKSNEQILWMLDKSINQTPPSKATVVNEQILGRVYVQKTSSYDNTALAGAEFTLYKEDGTTQVSGMNITNPQTTDATGGVTFGNLPLGKYVVKETKAPKGYVVSTETQTVTISDDTLQSCTFRDNRIDLSVSKLAVGGSAELPGAKLAITKTDGTTVVEWTSSTTPKKISYAELETSETYILKETSAPAGYAYSADIQFEIKADGTISITNSVANASVSGQTLVMRDAPIAISVAKVDETTSAHLSNAILAVIDAESGKELERFTTNGTVHALDMSKITVPAAENTKRDYILREISAPTGYEIAEDIIFAVDRAGTVYKKDATGYTTLAVVGTTATLTMRDKQKPEGTIYIRKLTPTGNALSGATLAIYKETDDITTATPVVSFESGTTPKAIKVDDSGNAAETLKAGEKYKLVEISAPAGYLVAKEITFTVTKNTSAQYRITTISDPNSLNGDQVTIMVTDQPLSLRIKKETSSGDLLAGATLELYKRNTDGSKGSKIDSFTTNRTNMYTVEFTKLQAGQEYLLVETAAPNGFLKSGDIKFTIEANGSITKQYLQQENGTWKESRVSGNTVIMTDDEEAVTLSKIDSGTNGNLAGATVKLESVVYGSYGVRGYDPNFTPQTFTTTNDVISLDANLFHTGCVYALSEVTAPQGYGYAKNVVFLYTDDHRVQYLTSSNTGRDRTVYMFDEPMKLSVHKKNSVTNGYVKDAKLQILDDAGIVVTSWTTGIDAKAVGGKLTAPVAGRKRYILRETEAPKGYTKANDISFEVASDGTIYIADVNGNYTQAVTEITMHDEPQLQVIKQNPDGDAVAGATLTITKKDDTAFTPITWVSTDEPKVFDNSQFAPDETYILTETKAPDGYGYAKPVSFTIGADGTVKADGKVVANHTIGMTDTPIEVVFEKQDADSKHTIAGAQIAIQNAAGDVIYTFTTTERAVTIPKEVLQAPAKEGILANYTFVELSAPFGYEKAEPVAFAIDSEGNVYAKNPENGEMTLLSSLGIKALIMYDAPNYLHISKVDATNSEEIDGAKLAIRDADGNEIISWESSKKDGAKKLSISEYFEADKEYMLNEVEAPKGYELAEAIVFKIGTDNVIYVKDAGGAFAAVTDQTIVMKDLPSTSVVTTETTTTTTTTTSSNTSKKTGDTAPVAPITVVMLVAAVGIIILGVVKKKRNDK